MSRGRRLVVLGICCLSLFMISLDTTGVNVALPAMAEDLRASVSGLQWIVDAYSIVIASFLLFAGAAADRFGRRRVFETGLAVFAVGSELCSLAPSLGWLVGFRALQALGGSMLTPVAMSILSSVFADARERAWAIGVWVSTFGLGMAAGPLLGGFLTEAAGWRSVFWVNAPVGMLVLAATLVVVPESRASKPRRPDPVAQVLVVVMLGAVVYAIIQGAHSDWRAPGIRGLFVAALVALLLLLAWEMRRAEPLIDPRSFRCPAFSGAVATAVCVFACLSGFLFLSPMYLQVVRRMTPLEAGLHLLPAAVAIAVCPPLAAWLVGRVGPWLPLTLGGLALTVSMVAMSRLTASTGIDYLTVTFAMFGFGFAMTDGQISGAAAAALPPSQAGLASAIAATGRQVGQALGVAVGGSLLMASMHGTVRVSFARASHPAWMVLAACGCAVILLGLLAASARGAKHAVPGVPRGEMPPGPGRAAPQGAGRLWPSPPEWIPRYLMDLQYRDHLP
jgi:EmrB/QacA subfamily drug resistance transporter